MQHAVKDIEVEMQKLNQINDYSDKRAQVSNIRRILELILVHVGKRIAT